MFTLIANSFLTVSARTLMFHMNIYIPRDKIFQLIIRAFDLF